MAIRFPCDPQELVPHRAPFLLLDTVLTAEQGFAKATLTITKDNPFVYADATLDPLALVEMMAQCYAVAAGTTRNTSAEPALGYLAALKDVHFFAPVRLGDTLTADAQLSASLGNILVIEGQVHRGEELVCKGQYKVFVAA